MATHRSEMVVGRIPVLACLRARKRAPRTLFTARGVLRETPEIRMAAAGIPVEEATQEALDRLSGGTLHQGVVLHAEPLPLLTARQWLGTLQRDAGLIILDGVEDPQNFGAICRSTAACGAQGVLFAKDRAAPVSPASMKAAAGAMEYIDLIQETNIARAMAVLQDAGFWTAALDAQGDKILWDANLRGRTAFIIGSEGLGIRRLVREKADYLLRIPITGPITSLNASVSAGIVLAEWMRQNQQG